MTTMVGAPVLAEVFVPGRAKTKGSMTARAGAQCRCCAACKGRIFTGAMSEGVAGSTQWRSLIRRSVEVMRLQYGLTGSYDGPVGVRMCAWLDPLGNVVASHETAPIEARAGDGDKLDRNVLDALKDAGVYRDDNQVVRRLADKVHALREPGCVGQGMLIQVWAMPAWALRFQREEAARDLSRTLGLRYLG